MLFKGNEVYGIGTIAKLYAESAPGMRFVCFRDGALTDWLAQRGHEVHRTEGLAMLRMGPGLGRLYLLPELTRARRTATQLHALLAPLGVRVIHAHWYGHYLVAGFMRRRGYRSVWQINNFMSPGQLLAPRRWIHQRIAEWGADLLLPASDFVAAEWAGSRAALRTVRNAAASLLPEPSELSGRSVRCVSAGRLLETKGHHVAVEAVLQLRREGHDIRLDVVGGPLEDNPYARGLQAMIDQAGDGEAVRLLGFRSDLRSLHADYDVALQCRLDPEPCSLWVCEAAADGLAVVGSATGGTPELVVDGETGLLYEAGDSRALGDRLRELVGDRGRLLAMRRAAHRHGALDLSPERMMRETFEAYGGPPAPR
jgi:glycosyltransferase involved in cell wall biosynthesis